MARLGRHDGTAWPEAGTARRAAGPGRHSPMTIYTDAEAPRACVGPTRTFHSFPRRLYVPDYQLFDVRETAQQKTQRDMNQGTEAPL